MDGGQEGAREGRLAQIRAAIVADPENAWATEMGYEPLYVAHPAARIVVIGQAPGRKAQESQLAWNDVSGRTLLTWLDVDEATFRRPDLFAILPMDFYYPGKAAHGDLPPRKGFAERWHPPLLAEMPGIRLTLVVGAHAQRYYLGRTGSLTENVRAFRSHLPGVVPLVHPSPLNFRWQTRNPWFASELLPVLRRRVSEVLERD
ncbi:uracil-DNA glycosylase family protein [Nocardioides sp. DS6]|uniref:Uracil-DNA glycosylase family protein n=1 Tax=Nocardioides eburneus TaxID=3231482 RepID=A0ABV3SZ87_9ACTN